MAQEQDTSSISSVKMDNRSIAYEILHAFEEGWGSYTSACSPMTTFKEEWETSIAKRVYDELILLGD